MNEDDLVSRWLNAVLISDVTLAALTPGGIFEGMAPPETPTPYVYYSMASGVDIEVGARIMTNMLWDVTAVAQTTDTRVMRPISDRIDELLQGADATTAQGYILQAHRTALIRRGPDKAENGKLYLYRTLEYRIYARAA